ncbi:MAG TPA: methylthioribulose 1-phosphate dehydratase [Vicinamibacterales bacterium]|nr:methylthioribulose 1-phosphate dehydratase [Vicinamibacterales bacterium]
MPTFTAASKVLAGIGRRFYDRGWVLGTSGNFSAVVSQKPLTLAITPSGAHKGQLSGREFLAIDGSGRISSARRTVAPAHGARSAAKPSAETALHLLLVRQRGAAAVLHTHSVWSTILSGRHAGEGGVSIEGYEMLKGLTGVTTHTHREWIPIVANDQDMTRLAGVVERTLGRHPAAHAFLLERHGLYTWGATIAEAERHVEILEFLFETIGRSKEA